MTTQPILLKLAQQGDARAIAALMNYALQSQEIRVKARLEGRCLQVLLKSARPLDQHAAVAFIRRGILRLQTEAIDSVRAYAWQVGREFPTWIVEVPTERISLPQSRLEALSQLSKAELEALARQENVHAMTLLLNQAVAHRDMTIKVVWKYKRLYLLAESARVPNQELCTNLISQELANLSITTAEIVKLYGRQRGERAATWTQELKPRILPVASSRAGANQPALCQPMLAQRQHEVTSINQQSMTKAVQTPLPSAEVTSSPITSSPTALAANLRKPADRSQVERELPLASMPQPATIASRQTSPPTNRNTRSASKPQFELFKLGFVVVVFVMAYFVVIGV